MYAYAENGEILMFYPFIHMGGKDIFSFTWWYVCVKAKLTFVRFFMNLFLGMHLCDVRKKLKGLWWNMKDFFYRILQQKFLGFEGYLGLSPEWIALGRCMEWVCTRCLSVVSPLGLITNVTIESFEVFFTNIVQQVGQCPTVELFF